MSDPSTPPIPAATSSGDGGRPLSPVATLLVGLAIVGLVRQFGGSRVLGEPRPARPVSTHGPELAVMPREARQPGRGRLADHPVAIPARGWWDIARRVFDAIWEDRILAVAAGVTFLGLLALFPAIGAFVALYGLVSNTSTIVNHLTALSDVLPQGAIEIISDQVVRITSKGDATLGVAFFTGFGMSLWSANAGMKAMFDALNVAYQEQEKRNFFVLNIWSLGFTFATITFLVVAISAVVIIPVILKFLWLGAATEWIMWAGRWPALALLTLAAIAILYRYGPSRERARWVWLSPGAVFAALGWLVVSMMFSWYVANFGAYNETYGSLGAVIGFMTWMWLSTIIVLVGAEISAETEHQTVRDTTEGPPLPLGRRGAHMADTVGRAH